MKPALHVLCSSEANRDAWRKRAGFHCDLEVILEYPVKSAIATIHSLAAKHERPFLVCRDSVWLGLGLGRQAERLVEELDGRFPNWGACGNRGVRWDDYQFDFGRGIGIAALRTAVCPHTVISVDDHVLLIHPAALRKHAEPAPPVESLRAGVPLSLECLVNGSVMAVSPRLMVLRTDEEPDDSQPELEADAEFQRYYRDHFLNHRFPVPRGGLDLSGLVDFEYVSNVASAPKQADALELFDRGLAQAKKKPSLTICCRTQFNRPEMLERAVLSFSVCRSQAAVDDGAESQTSLLSDLQIRLITDLPESAGKPALERLTAAYPAARLECWFETVRAKWLSRIDLMVAAIRRCQTDYIWFIDDDDYIHPSAFPALARCLVPDSPLLVVASSPRMTEQWETVEGTGDGPAKRILGPAEKSAGYPAAGIFGVLRGNNQIHLCGSIFPVKLMRERLRHCEPLGEYSEDYYLLLLAVTAPRVEVMIIETELAAFSARGTENTTAETDRSIWHQSYATFLLEVLNNEEGNSPFLWQQANAWPWDWGEP